MRRSIRLLDISCVMKYARSCTMRFILLYAHLLWSHKQSGYIKSVKERSPERVIFNSSPRINDVQSTNSHSQVYILMTLTWYGDLPVKF